ISLTLHAALKLMKNGHLPVVNRKVWGGNRTWVGAEVQSILMTILVTANQQTINTLDFLKQTMISPQPRLLPLSGR
ncbi:MAG: hypothetical protein ACKVII_22615, partial [Planctomycetales bacterium]